MKSGPDTRDDLELLVTTAFRYFPVLLLSGGLAGAAGYAIAQRITPSYLAEATLMIEPRTSAARQGEAILALPEDSTSRAWVTRSEAAIASSLAVAQRAIATLPADERATLISAAGDATPGTQGLGPTDLLLIGYRAAVSIYNDPNTFLIRSRAEAPTAAMAADLANAHAQAYLRHGVDRKLAEIDRIDRSVGAELAAVDAGIASTEAELEALRGQGLSLAVATPGFVASRISSLYEQTEAARADLLTRQLDLAALDGSAAPSATDSADSFIWMQTRLLDLNTEIASTSRFSERDPATTRLQSQRDALVTALDGAREAERAQKRAEVAAMTQRVAELQAQARSLEVEANAREGARARFDGLTARLASFETQRSALIERQSQVRAQRTDTASDVALVEPASPPLQPRWPKVPLMTAISGTLGALLALAVVLWRERHRQRPAAARPAAAPVQPWPLGRRRVSEAATEERRLAGPGGARI